MATIVNIFDTVLNARDEPGVDYTNQTSMIPMIPASVNAFEDILYVSLKFSEDIAKIKTKS